MWRADEVANGIGIKEIEKAQLQVEAHTEASTKVWSATLFGDYY